MSLRTPSLPPGFVEVDLSKYTHGLEQLRSWGRAHFSFDLRTNEYVIRVETERFDVGPSILTIDDHKFRVVYERRDVVMGQRVPSMR